MAQMAGKDILCSMTFLALLGLFLHGSFGTAQNLTQYYGQTCDPKLQQCNRELEPVSASLIYVLLVCRDRKCMCPDFFEFNGTRLNATGYEWREERAQCLMSLNSTCTGPGRTLCASANCVDGTCRHETVTPRDTKNSTAEDNNGAHRGGLPLLTLLFLPIVYHSSH